MDGIFVYIVMAATLAACLIFPFVMLVFMKRKGQAEIDHYGKYRGSGPAKSFVCPACLHRSYAASHVAKRWCVRCDKSFPDELNIESPANGRPE